eukprot:TRINITY_DN477_c0_g2_i3.p1 TRINITY_DN477_c0_g2~~TRINITY_DN477_c0_g2_i3.p1  ORF type:complete len:383 (+),score=62.05 TRINITY_DN477_c0_g2_i3:79-1227(+)
MAMACHDATLKMFGSAVMHSSKHELGKSAAKHPKLQGGATRSLQQKALAAGRKLGRQETPAEAHSMQPSSPCIVHCKQQFSDQVKIGIESEQGCPPQQRDDASQEEIARSYTPFSPMQEHAQQYPSHENGTDGQCPRANAASGKHTKPYTGALPPFTPDVWSSAVGAQVWLAMPGESTPPSTPNVSSWTNVTTPPGAPNQGEAFVNPLFRALLHGSLKDVQSALESEPDAAFLPIFECNAEPPLCCSVRMGCSEQVVQLLLQHGARVDVEDRHGQTPLMLLSSTPSNYPPAFFDFASDAGNSGRQRSLNIAKILMDAEADSASLHRHLLSCVDLAYQAGNSHLVRLYRGESHVAAQESDREFLGMPAMSDMLPWTMSEPPVF